MDPDLAKRLRALITGHEVAALGTLHEGAPFVSMVPYALLPEGAGFVIHVSSLAAHTRDMVASPAVSLMVMAAPSAEVPAQAVARVTIQGEAVRISPSPLGEGRGEGPNEAPIHELAKRLYLGRFPQSAETFELGDFALFAIRPRQARYVGGFAQAKTITAESLAEALR